MKKALILEVICGLFFMLFLYTGIIKLIDHGDFIFDLGRDPLIGKNLAVFISIALPIVELAVAIFTIIPRTRKYGLRATFVLMASFTIYVRWMIHDPTRHCTLHKKANTM